jgi:hypothetical protein
MSVIGNAATDISAVIGNAATDISAQEGPYVTNEMQQPDVNTKGDSTT